MSFPEPAANTIPPIQIIMPGPYWLDITLTIATIVLAIVGVWYTWETRKQRIQMQKQLRFLRRQWCESVKPVLGVAIYLKREEELVTLAYSGPLTERSQEDIRTMLSGHKWGFMLQVGNASGCDALDVFVVVYDDLSKSFIHAVHNCVIISAKQDWEFACVGPRYQREPVLVALEQNYGKDYVPFFENVLLDRQDQSSHAYAFYLDRAGVMHAAVRDFSVIETENRTLHLNITHAKYDPFESS